MPDGTPAVSVIVPARNAAGTITDTVAALEAQDFRREWELILVDDGSDDATVPRARAVASDRLTVIPGEGHGAGEARNRGVAAARAELLAFTDADCAPQPGWLSAGVAALENADLVQGRVVPDPGVPLGPFDRTLWVDGERGFYETANLFVRRDLFDSLGGFEEWLRIGGRPFAEDLWFGWRAVRAGARTQFVSDALVHHAVFPRGALDFVDERRRLVHFPAVARRVPEFRRRTMFAGVFLSRRSAAFHAAAAGVAVAAARRSPLPLAAALPYGWMIGRWARPYRKRAPLVAAVGTVADAVGVAALAYGSARARSLVL
jgi:glycosyltransferase involved in cell wall biosynthesis